MKLKYLVAICAIYLLVGCSKLNDINFVKPPENKLLINYSNQSNTTVIIKDTLSLANGTNIFIMRDSLLIVDNGRSYLIDTPLQNPVVLNAITQLNLASSEFIIATNNKDEHNGGIVYSALKLLPNTIYDNGIDNPNRQKYIERISKYLEYSKRNNLSFEVVPINTKIDNFQILVPYVNGLSTNQDENSMAVVYNNLVGYMSDCYGSCETKIPPITAKYLILANNGYCPTNSFDFILSTGAEYLIGQDICPQLLSEINYLGIKTITLQQNQVLQIITGDIEDEIRYKTI